MTIRHLLDTSVARLSARFGYRISRIRHDDLELYYSLYGKTAVREKRFYNIGSGGFRHPAWTNVDHASQHYRSVQKTAGIDIDIDLLTDDPIPVDDEMAEVLYTSHTIEHLTDPSVRHLISEAYRILKRGGVFRVTTDDVDLDYRAYRSGDKLWFYTYPQVWSIQRMFKTHFATSVNIDDGELDEVFDTMTYEDALDYCVSKSEVDPDSPENHVSWWNQDKLIRYLGKWFESPYRSGYGQSRCPILRNTDFFDNTHPKMSIYVEALKQ